MRAVTCHETQLEVAEVPDPVPGPGQVLLDVERCGICGSDLHARVHADQTADDVAAVGYHDFMRSSHTVVLGHEFCGTVAGYGPDCRKKWPLGTRVVSLPIIRRDGEIQLTGLSAKAPGGYAQQVLATESMSMRVPAGLEADAAVLTEPLAVALHAVRRGEVGPKDTAVVIGCGPIGLGVIAMLKATGVRTVIASDFSAGRRALAQACGADLVVDPATDSPWSSFAQSKRYLTESIGLADRGITAMDKLRRVPYLPWWHVLRAADKLGATPRGPVVFECVGVPGMIEQIVTAAPLLTRVVVVGVCMAPDTFRPSVAINKEVDLRFVFGYDPAEFRQTLHWIAEGKINVAPFVTGTVGLEGVANAFDALGDPERHAKILIDPSSGRTQP
ncbi:zinc-binding dehydrogenase [Nocardia sp. NPDC059180]|uniref:zinc-binding dehydrogenase n=1 Tax=Nocardia sp. NPDC059180 TaxID=3346761 RepID=UPI0036AD0028